MKRDVGGGRRSCLDRFSIRGRFRTLSNRTSSASLFFLFVCLPKSGPFSASFSSFSFFQLLCENDNVLYKIADGWIQTCVQLCWKQLLCHLCHNQLGQCEPSSPSAKGSMAQMSLPKLSSSRSLFFVERLKSF